MKTNLNHPIIMLTNTIIFLVLAIVAGALGFGVLAGTAALIAKICLAIFVILLVVSLITGKRPPV